MSGRVVLVLRVVAGLVFVVFGAGKFVNHASEAAAFGAYGLPWPDAFTDAIGVIEILGGLALLSGVALTPAALVLAGDMVGAIVISGLLRWEWISLTVAPALLAAMLVVAGRSALPALRDEHDAEPVGIREGQPVLGPIRVGGAHRFGAEAFGDGADRRPVTQVEHQQ